MDYAYPEDADRAVVNKITKFGEVAGEWLPDGVSRLEGVMVQVPGRGVREAICIVIGSNYTEYDLEWAKYAHEQEVYKDVQKVLDLDTEPGWFYHNSLE